MSDSIFLEPGRITNLSMPQHSNWQCRMVPGPYGFVIRPIKGYEPNRFHMFMQWLVLGFKWEKVK